MFPLIVTFGVLVLTVSGQITDKPTKSIADIGYCRSDVESACKATSEYKISKCNTSYTHLHNELPQLQQYTALHIDHNFKYLLMSAYFNNYKANRAGFSNLYRKLADDTWEDALNLVKYMAKRGFNMEYGLATLQNDGWSITPSIQSYKMNELHSLSTSLDMNKRRAEDANRIHLSVVRHDTGHHDAETAHYLQEEFAGKHAQQIRDLTGHVNDLYQLIYGTEESSLAIYLFDEYLQKTLA